jgi:prepilin-type N-terminal cleavage/methylation domain-containing protein
MFRMKNKGFTLIELLVVIAIIGILSSVVLASLNTARQKGRDARRLSDVKQIRTAMDLYYDTGQSYPLSIGNASSSVLITGGYISTIPVDPSTGASYSYAPLATSGGATECTTTPCESYVIAAVLESANNVVLDNDTDENPITGSFDCTDPVYCVIQ